MLCRDRSLAVRVAAARALDCIFEQGGHKMESSEVTGRVAAQASALAEEVGERIAVDMLSGEHPDPDSQIQQLHRHVASIVRRLKSYDGGGYAGNE